MALMGNDICKVQTLIVIFRFSNNHPAFSGVHVAQSLVFCVMVCRSLFVLFFFRQLCYCKFGNYCIHLLLRSSKIFTYCDFYYCEAWSPPVQMDTYDSEMRGLFIAISHISRIFRNNKNIAIISEFTVSVIVRFTASVCSFGIFKHFLQNTCISNWRKVGTSRETTFDCHWNSFVGTNN
jgi:hypothetical protein